MSAVPGPRKKWYQIQWFQDQDTPRERKFINKLDLLIVPYAFLAYWVKYIDQANLSKPPPPLPPPFPTFLNPNHH